MDLIGDGLSGRDRRHGARRIAASWTRDGRLCAVRAGPRHCEQAAPSVAASMMAHHEQIGEIARLPQEIGVLRQSATANLGLVDNATMAIVPVGEVKSLAPGACSRITVIWPRYV
jgi:hypothetical protein